MMKEEVTKVNQEAWGICQTVESYYSCSTDNITYAKDELR